MIRHHYAVDIANIFETLMNEDMEIEDHAEATVADMAATVAP